MAVVCGCIRYVVAIEEGYRMMVNLNVLCVEEGRWRKGYGRGMSLTVCPFECVEKSSYMGDVICASEVDRSSSFTRVRRGWKRFRELFPF